MTSAHLFVLALCGALFASGLDASEKRSFSGYSVLRAQVQDRDQAEALHNLEQTGKHDFWTDVKLEGPVDIMVQENERQDVAQYLTNNGMSFRTMVENVQELIDLSPVTKGSSRSGQGHNMDWDSYHPLEDMYSYLDYIESTFDYASTEVIGQSYEGTDMRLMKICKGGCGNKPAMWIDGGIHAREWIAPAAVMYMIKQLTEDVGGQEDLIDNLDWYILPCVNPDGYAWTQDPNGDRMWRKTRSSYAGDLCIGTDGNRNYGFHWNEGGSSPNSCLDTYMGPSAFSEIENQNVKGFIDTNAPAIKFFNSIHAYSQYILLPWGWTFDVAPNYDEMYAFAERGVQALTALYGTEYTIGCIPCLLYPASGGSLDYALGEGGIKYSFGMELRDTGTFGFLLPPAQILPTSEETWAFHVSAARDVVAEFGS